MRAGLVDLDHRWLLSTGKGVNTNFYQVLLRQQVVSILMENMSSCGTSASPRSQEHPAVLGRILDSGRLAPIFTRIENAGLLRHVLKAKVQATPHINLTSLCPYMPRNGTD
jgi:hypothetical protein